MQRHYHRSEYWHIIEGKCKVTHYTEHNDKQTSLVLDKHNGHLIPNEWWHQLANPYDKPCKIVEIQYGDLCAEDDIERSDK